jgi:poly(3-hydroxybutyrate) depolymerase
MKRKYLFVFIIVLVMCSAVFSQKIASNTSPKIRRVLFIGNSLTFYHEMPRVLSNLLVSAHIKPDFYIFMVAPGGFTLAMHYDKEQVRDLIQKGNWDYVVLQEASHGTVSDKKQFFDYSRRLDDLIKKAGAKTIFYMTWAYKNDPNMFEPVADSYLEIAQDVNAIVAPVSLAWQKVLKDANNIQLYDNNDNVHPSPAGAYVTACVFYITLTGRNPQGLPNGGLNMLNREKITTLQKIAWQTISDSNKKQKYMTEQAFENFTKNQQIQQEKRRDIFEKVIVPDINDNYNYLVYKPPGYEKKKDWPLILFLHGVKEGSNNLDLVKKTALPQILEEGKDLPFVVICPQCREKQVWDEDKLIKLLDKVVEKYSVDKNRIYLTGESMGGYGSWSLGYTYPERFAAIAPICGGGRASQAAKLKNVPIWAFHNENDDIVLSSESQDMVDAVNKAGGNAKLTIYPDSGHDAWTQTYKNDQLYEWFLEHNLKEKTKDEQ